MSRRKSSGRWRSQHRGWCLVWDSSRSRVGQTLGLRCFSWSLLIDLKSACRGARCRPPPGWSRGQMVERFRLVTDGPTSSLCVCGLTSFEFDLQCVTSFPLSLPLRLQFESLRLHPRFKYRFHWESVHLTYVCHHRDLTSHKLICIFKAQSKAAVKFWKFHFQG